jgi:membrane-associated phospholipid phosphatase
VKAPSVIAVDPCGPADPLLPPDSWGAPVPRGRYLLFLMAQYLVWLALYLGVNTITAGRAMGRPFLPFEERIPFIAAAYPLYASVYLEVLLPLLVARTRRAFLRTQLAVGLASLMAFAVFLAAPMAYPRPTLGLDSAFEAMLSAAWTVDGPRNTFPSLHVAIALLLYLGMRGEVPRWRVPLLLLALGVCISTVLVKQHFIVDVLGGAVLALLAWRLTGALMTRTVWLGAGRGGK